MKSSLSASRRDLLEKLRAVVFTNPFSGDRTRLDAEILGRTGERSLKGARWSADDSEQETAARLAAVTRRELESIPADERKQILSGYDATSFLLRDVICFLLFYENYRQMDGLIERTLGNESGEAHKHAVTFYSGFEREIGRWFDLREEPVSRDGEQPPEGGNWVIDRAWAARIFGVFYQLRRAYYFIYYRVIGGSPAIQRLREAIWEAVFTRNLEWYWRYLLGRMADFSTLIAGPTGSGKEQVAQAICRSQYIPFNPATRKFESGDRELFLPINLASLSPTLIESELFGHVKGAFTGAVEERDGLMDACSPYGAIFLDEIGELAPEMQVKLLRVLQTRNFYPLGGRKLRRFEGRIVSATNQDVAKQIRDGKMREDFYYRLSACQITTPSLRERFDEDPEEIIQLTTFLLRRMLGTEQAELEGMMIDSVREATKRGRPWRGNVRELEQFIRQRLAGRIEEGTVDPLMTPSEDWLSRASRADLTIGELLRHYCKTARARHGSWEATAKALDADWRTIKKWAE